MRGVYKQVKKRYRMPDTAHDCPILRIGVVHDQPVSEREIYGMWSFSLSSTASSCTTKPPSSRFRFDNAVGKMLLVWCWFSAGRDDRQVSQSGKPLCTGTSLWAVPKLARGLCPLEPRHVNGVSIPAKCPLDIPTEHLLID